MINGKWDVTYHKDAFDEETLAAIPMIKKRTTAREIPDNIIFLLPTKVMNQNVKKLLISANPIPNSIIIEACDDERPAVIIKYGALEMKVAPII